MTTIAWDGKILAADSLATCGTLRSKVVKIVRSASGFLCAGAGEFSAVVPWLRWVEGGLVPDDRPGELGSKATVIIVDPRGRAHTLEGAPVRVPVLDKFWALGTGAELAMGAMAMGADAAQAVRIAAKFDVHTGGRVVAMKPGVE